MATGNKAEAETLQVIRNIRIDQILNKYCLELVFEAVW